MKSESNTAKIFINLSNHSSKAWNSTQLRMAATYGRIVDIPFPQVNSHATSEEIDMLVNQYFDKVVSYNPAAVMLQGEFVFTYRLVKKLKDAGIKVLASSSERKVNEIILADGSTQKSSLFEFVMFKEY